LVRFAEKCSRRHHELVQGYAIARVRHLVIFKLVAFNRMYDRRHLSAITRATRIFVAVRRSPEHDDSAQIRTTRAQAAVVSTGITPMVFIRQ
jgi:hypothetical protein